MRHAILLFYTLIVSSLAVTANKDIVRVDQGWNALDRDIIYNISEGSEIMPLRWFLNLEQPNSQEMLSTQLEKYGFIYDAKNTKNNPYKLPIGVTTHIDDLTKKLYGENQWVGVNCTACHTGSVEIGNKTLVIDGAPTLFNIQNFESDIIASVKSTLNDNKKLMRFLNSLSIPKEQQGRTIINLNYFLAEFRDWTARSHTYIDQNGKEVLNGPGRIDGLGGPTNDLTCKLTSRMSDPMLEADYGNLANCEKAHPSVSLPQLWGMVDLEWVQWEGNVHAAIFRNYGQATGTYGKNWVEKNNLGVPILKSTAKIIEVQKIEDIYKKLNSPEWNQLIKAGLAQELDLKKVIRGEQLYKTNCLSCHAVQPTFSAPNSHGNQYWQTPTFTAQELGTDPAYTLRNEKRKSFIPKALLDQYSLVFKKEEFDGAGRVPTSKLRALNILNMSTIAFVTQNYPDGGPSALDLFLNTFDLKTFSDFPEFTSCRDLTNVQKKPGFRGRSLEGIGFTAPYLHNGSVPTLDDLLKPAAQRPVTFYVGCKQYDLAKLGYNCSAKDQSSFLFDTRLETNSNSGHEYGTNLTSEQRKDLIEYIKGIKNPARPSRKNNCY